MSILTEEWRPVVGYEGCYNVSNLGRVKSLERFSRGHDTRGQFSIRHLKERILVPVSLGNGYVAVKLHSRQKQQKASRYLVHHLVAAAFLGPRPPGLWVLHGPNGSSDNSTANLRYGTPKENSADRYRDGTALLGESNVSSKLSRAQVVEIKQALNQGVLNKTLAAMYNVNPTTISNIKTGHTWAWLDAV